MDEIAEFCARGGTVTRDGTSETLSHWAMKTKRATTYDLEEMYNQFLNLKTDYQRKLEQYNQDRKALQDNVDKKVLEMQQNLNRKVSMDVYKKMTATHCRPTYGISKTGQSTKLVKRAIRQILLLISR